MAVILPSPRWPRVPGKDASKFRTTVTSAAMQGYADAVNHLAAYRGRHAAHAMVTYDTSSTPIEEQDPAGVSEELRVVWRSSEIARHLVVIVEYQAHRHVVGNNPSIDCTLLRHSAGPIIDAVGGGGPAFTWQRSDGTLPTSRVVLRSAVFPLYATVYRYPRKTVTSTLLVNDAPGAYPTRPRVLAIPSGDAGNWLQVHLEPTDVRILSCDIWEMFEDRVTI